MSPELRTLGETREALSSRATVRLPQRTLRWSEILAAPVHDFPIRDEILHQFAPMLYGLRILEVGPGSGFTAYTLSGAVEELTLVDYAETTLSDLRQKLGADSKIRFAQFDISQPGLAVRVQQTYDFVFGLDIFEYVPDEVQGLTNLAAVLNSGGSMFLTFPNVTASLGDGVTRYVYRRDLEESLEKAGFRRWEIRVVRLKPYSRWVYAIMHEWPLRLYRGLRKRNNINLPQTYEQTWAFQHRGSLQFLKPFLHFYWTFLGAIIRLGGPLFEAKPAPDDLLGYQLVVTASV